MKIRNMAEYTTLRAIWVRRKLKIKQKLNKKLF